MIQLSRYLILHSLKWKEHDTVTSEISKQKRACDSGDLGERNVGTRVAGKGQRHLRWRAG